MKSKRDPATGDVTLTLTADEAHVLIWGGPQDVVDGIDAMIRISLVNIEDNEMPTTEYNRRFGDLEALYQRLRTDMAMNAA